MLASGTALIFEHHIRQMWMQLAGGKKQNCLWLCLSKSGMLKSLDIFVSFFSYSTQMKLTVVRNRDLCRPQIDPFNSFLWIWMAHLYPPIIVSVTFTTGNIGYYSDVRLSILSFIPESNRCYEHENSLMIVKKEIHQWPKYLSPSKSQSTHAMNWYTQWNGIS